MKYSSFKHTVLSATAIFAITLFAAWWFNPAHLPKNFTGVLSIFDVLLFLLVSYIIWHPIIMEVLTWSISSHIKEIPEQLPVPGHRVAFITTIVPKSEPIDLLHACLPAMVNAEYPHDTWVLDEGNSPEVMRICHQYGVYHFSRHGLSHYNEPSGKFATKTKGGNHNSWYDSYGNYYDFVAQIDTDFVPEPTFLTKTLGYFRDPHIAFVGTPQIYGNINESFIARGAAEQQYSFYGTVLRGLSGMDTTLLIGANHVIRVAALKSVDHYSAHITEDLLTGMKLHYSGWKSLYVPYALAIGEGPTTWEAYLNQQMRWAYGCIDILFRHSPKLFRKMGFRRTIYYFFLQQHYFSGLAMALSLILLIAYFAGGFQSADVNVITFFTLYSLVMVVCWLMSVWLQRYHIRYKEESGMLLAGKIISIAAWPIWFLACISVMRGKRLTYKVTPKGEQESNRVVFSPVFISHLIFGLIATLCLVSTIGTHRYNGAMVFWAGISALLMLCVPFTEDLVQFVKNIRSKLYMLSENIHAKNKTEQMDVSSYPQENTLLQTVNDCFFLTAVTISSFILYIHHLGFYSDDWSFIGNFKLAQNQTFWGLVQTATTPNTAMRPVQNFYDALLYWIFGTQPLGYHSINSLGILAITIMIYLVAKRLTFPRIIALSLALVYILLPNYATNRFWHASAQANLSILFYLISLYAALRAFSNETTKKITWQIVSLLTLLISALSYEVIIPLYFLNVILIWNPANIFRLPQKNETKNGHNRSVFIVIFLIVIAYIFEFKFLTTTRLSNTPPGIGNFPGYSFRLLTQAFNSNYLYYIFGIPHILEKIVAYYFNIQILIYGCTIGLAVFSYLYFVISRPNANFPNHIWMRNLTLISFAVFYLGYAIFLLNDNGGFSPTGITNRVAIAGAIGVALTLIGFSGWISQLVLREKFAKIFYSASIASICTIGFIVINTMSIFWISAYQQQQVVLADVVAHFPAMYDDTTILLDGVCPYIGPASVFEAEWDVKGALQSKYYLTSLNANIVTPNLKITEKGIETSIYNFKQTYSFAPNNKIMIYNYKNKMIYKITNSEEAIHYFQTINPNYKTNCPAGSAGNGVEIF